MKILINDSLNYLNIPNNLFNVNFNKELVHQVFISYKSNIRQNTKLNKNRSNVSGSGKKPWKQKGTGRARSGCIRSPIWRSGGVTFGNQIKSYKKKINKKMYRLACISVLSEFIKNNKLLIFNNFSIDRISSNLLYKKVYSYCKNKKTLILIKEYNINLIKSSNNIHFIKVCILKNQSLINILNFDFVIMNINVIKSIEGFLKV